MLRSAMDDILITRESLFSHRLSLTPNAIALPQEVLAQVQTAMHALTRVPLNGRSFEVIVIDDDPHEPIAGCFVYEDEREPGVFVATVSAALVSLLYLLNVSFAEALDCQDEGCNSDRFQVPHPSTRYYAEAVELLCRDCREPTPPLRRIFAPAESVSSRWPALEELSLRIGQRQRKRNDGVGVDASHAQNVCAAIRFVVEHEYGHAVRRHFEIRRLGCEENPQRLPFASYTWSAEYEADQFAYTEILKDVACILSVENLPVGEFEHPREREMIYWWAFCEQIHLVMSLMFIEQMLTREEERIGQLDGMREVFVERQQQLLSLDDYPSVSFRFTIAHRRIWESVVPDAPQEIIRMARHYLRYKVDQKVTACAEWFEDPTLLALGAVVFDDCDSFEVEERFLGHCQRTFYEIMGDLPPFPNSDA